MAPPDKNRQNLSPAEPVSEETVLKIAKEIAIKFIEVGRITPANFERSFKDILAAIASAVRKN